MIIKIETDKKEMEVEKVQSKNLISFSIESKEFGNDDLILIDLSYEQCNELIKFLKEAMIESYAV
jgi:hypothetical protein